MTSSIITLDSITRRLAMGYNRVQRIGSSIASKLSPYLMWHSNTSNNRNDNQPRILRTDWGEELGYLVDMTFFTRSMFSEEQLALIDYSDKRSKELHKGETREMGGVYENHPLDMIKMYFKVAEEVAGIMGLPLDQILDYRFHISLRRHDDFEDPIRLRKYVNDFKDGLERAMRRDPELKKLSPEYKRMTAARAELKKQRAEIIAEEYDMQNNFIRRNIKGEKSNLALDGAMAIGLDDWLARHIEEHFFTGSMFFLSQRYATDDYIHHGRGGPFQVHLMNILGIDDQHNEPAVYYLMRINLKLFDRIVLSREIKPRYKPRQARDLKLHFNRNAWLREMYGDDINFRGQSISRPDLLKTLYRNFVVQNNIHHQLNKSGHEIVEELQANPLDFRYLLTIPILIGLLNDENRNIFYQLKPSYERDLGIRIAKEEQLYINGLPAYEFSKITGEGPISNGHRYETGQRINNEVSLSQIQKNYRDVLAFEKLRERFSDPQLNIFDARNGRFDLFRIEGLGEDTGIRFTSHPKPYSGD